MLHLWARNSTTQVNICFSRQVHLCMLELLQLCRLLRGLQQLLLCIPGVAVGGAIISLQYRACLSYR